MATNDLQDTSDKKEAIENAVFSSPSSVVSHRIVVKLGGEIMLKQASLDALARDMASLVGSNLQPVSGRQRSKIQIVVVHGGGPQADTLADRLGHTVRKVAGRRVTDDDALEIAKMVYGGSINLEILAALVRHGARPVGLSGVDANMITVTRRPPVMMRDPATGTEAMVDFGHVGDIEQVDLSLLDLLLDQGYVPVVASLAADPQGNIYNVNADTIAQALAVALQADRLVLVTNVPGIMLDPSDPETIIKECDTSRLHKLIAGGVISGGMLPKALNCIEAIEAGVKAVQILDGTGDKSLLLDSINGKGVGTVVVRGQGSGVRGQ
jgi:acetylglutamate kinase